MRLGRRRVDPLPILLVLCSLALYLPGSAWGVPHATAADRTHAWGNDDLVPLAPLAEMHNTFVEAKSDRNVAYPWFHYFLLACAYAPYLAWLALTGGLSLGPTTFPFGLADPVTAFRHLTYIGRAVSMALAIAAVLGSYYTAKHLWSRTAGLFAALATMLMFPLSYYARVGNLDVPVLGWTSLALAVIAAALRWDLTLRRAIAISALAALAVATKDQAAASFILLTPALVVVHWRAARGSDITEAGSWRPALAGVAAAAGAYVIASGIPVDPGRFVHHVGKVVGVGGGSTPLYNRYSPDLSGYAAQSVDLLNHLRDVMSDPLLIVAIAGILIASVRDRRSLVLALSALGCVLLLLPVRFSRLHYLLPVALPLNAFAGYALASLWQGLRIRRLAAGTAAAAIFSVLLLQAVDLTYQMRHDSRYSAAGWLAERARSGDRLCYFGAPLKVPALSSDVATVPVFYRALARPTILQRRPEFILVMPEDTDEERLRVDWRQGPYSIYNRYLPDGVYGELLDRSLGYRLAAQFQTERLLPWLYRPFLPYATVNPPIQVFARSDRAAGEPPVVPWRAAPHYPRPRRHYEPLAPMVAGRR